MQGDDEPNPKKEIEQMSPPTATSLGLESDGAPSLDGERLYPIAPHIQEQIGRRLAAVYDEILRQPIPDRFLRLLDQLDNATNSAPDPILPATLDQADPTALDRTVKMSKQRSPAKETEIE